MSVRVESTEIDGVLVVTPRRFEDHRGWFTETWNLRGLAEAGLDEVFVQDNQSRSSERGTIRGLHFQSAPHAQAKLVRVVRGAVVDVAVDLRDGSPTFGRHVKVTLDAAEGRQLFIPTGFAHGFLTLEPDTEVCYKVTDYYAPECDGGIIWNDPDLAIDWGIAAGEIVLSEKDAQLPRLSGFASSGASPT